VFLCFPVEGPRPAPMDGHHPLYRWLVGVDRPTNSLPSLHAGLTVYSLLFAARALRGALRPSTRVALGAIGALWGAAILYSTLATKQHWALDLPPGVLLAAGAHALAWRSAQAEPAVRRERSASQSVQTPTPAATSDRY
jgi:membrane-associated phospholipid phosphatase